MKKNDFMKLIVFILLNKSLFSHYKCFIFNGKMILWNWLFFKVYGLIERILKTLK